MTREQAKRQLGIPADDDSEDVSVDLFVAAASEYVAWRVGAGDTVEVTAYTERHQVRGAGTRIAPRRLPLVAVTSVTPDGGSALDAGAYIADVDLGVVYLDPPRTGWHTLVYTAGYATPPTSWTLAGLIIVQHLWSTLRGTGGMPRPGEEIWTATSGMAFAIPHRASELLQAAPVTGFA